MRKNWRGGGKSLLKNSTIEGYAYSTCYSRAGFTLCGAHEAKTKKSPTIGGLGPGTEPYGKSGAGYGITSIKRLDEGLR